ncbi:L,D-transpeptidase family protein [uncultured Ferrimonas sp.]|uniref:L,D-transpeptidase family protein n=1 Tax=uncultured Ferrimonas sp. TaxID=432640 RepID=UPI00262838C1|nr:L,D-transpeptidase family protein [uncultured Ferrimonas sp.]
MKSSLLKAVAIMAAWAMPVSAAIYSAPQDGSRLIGFPMEHRVEVGQTLDEIAQQYNMGFLALVAANPDADPLLPAPGSIIKLPSQMLLPDVPRKGVVVNLAELRLYYFDNARQRVHVFPIGIGVVGRETPIGATRVSQKRKDPTWTPTQTTRKKWLEENGEALPPVVPAGPDNPLGHRALRLGFGNGEYLIHGTNQEFGIGMRVSAGCMRLRYDDIETLFDMVRVGEPVRVINEAVKVAQERDQWLIEVHEPLSSDVELSRDEKQLQFSKVVEAQLQRANADPLHLEQALQSQLGLPLRLH